MVDCVCKEKMAKHPLIVIKSELFYLNYSTKLFSREN